MDQECCNCLIDGHTINTLTTNTEKSMFFPHYCLKYEENIYSINDECELFTLNLSMKVLNILNLCNAIL